MKPHKMKEFQLNMVRQESRVILLELQIRFSNLRPLEMRTKTAFITFLQEKVIRSGIQTIEGFRFNAITFCSPAVVVHCKLLLK